MTEILPTTWAAKSLILLQLLCIPVAESSTTENDLAVLLENEDIRNTWQPAHLRACIGASDAQPPKLWCYRKFGHRGYRPIDVEVFSERPLVLKISKFLDNEHLSAIRQYFQDSGDIESQGVEGYAYSKGHRGRRADGLWLEHNVNVMRPIFERLQRWTRINPAIAEEFLILKYETMGHYAIHYDHLDPMSADYDEGWFEYYGNRLATALLIVDVAERGGGTLFPRLNLTIQPEEGDLIFWLNADSNDSRELLALHAACPILASTKMAVSLWIRTTFQWDLRCSMKHAGYDADGMFRHIGEPFRVAEWLRERPKIPKWIFEKRFE